MKLVDKEDTILWNRESDRYFDRSLLSLEDDLRNSEQEAKKLFKIISQKAQIKKVLDVGCNCGVFTNFLAKFLPHAQVIGIDPSEEAVKFGRERFKNLTNLKFFVGHSDNLPVEGEFDLVILRMVLQWLPRKDFFKTISEIDKVARNYIYINEFYPSSALMSTSVHNKKVKIFKQDYSQIFTSVPYYTLIHKSVYEKENGDDFQRGEFLVKKLPLEEAYKKRASIQEADRIK
ncbi:class I SAM-dependent methyltransferase [Patescibacteria group bacterium]|nr:class I SAM-dependent methyltransferase [Patescibacteria group bacterium]